MYVYISQQLEVQDGRKTSEARMFPGEGTRYSLDAEVPRLGVQSLAQLLAQFKPACTKIYMGQ